MNNNYKDKEADILKIWEKAGNTLKNQQQLNKGKMETLLSKTSKEYSTGIKRLLKGDAIFKVILIFGFILVAALNLANLYVLALNLVCIIISTMSINQERKLIEGLDELQEYKGNIRNCLEKEIKYYQSNIFRYPFILSISVFLFYVLGSLIYHGIKYETIRPIEDLQDGIVLTSFLLFSVIFSFAVYYPYFTSRINYLQQLLTDIDQDELINGHIDKQKAKRRRSIIINSILILIGLLVLISLIIVYL
jgi:hypothetical protein